MTLARRGMLLTHAFIVTLALLLATTWTPSPSNQPSINPETKTRVPSVYSLGLVLTHYPGTH